MPEQPKYSIKKVMIDLEKIGINITMLTEITLLATYNPDQLCLANNAIPVVPVSHVLLRYSKRPKKLLKIFKKLGIYNILLINKEADSYTFMGKSFSGGLLSYSIPKGLGVTPKIACGLAILDFVGQVLTPRAINTEDSTEAMVNIDMDNLADANISPEVRESIQDLIKRIKNGEFPNAEENN